MILYFGFICLFLFFLYRVVVKRKELYRAYEAWRNRFVLAEYKKVRMPMRFEEAEAFVNSLASVKRKVANEYKRNLRKGRIKEVYNEKGEKHIVKTEKMKNYAR